MISKILIAFHDFVVAFGLASAAGLCFAMLVITVYAIIGENEQ